MKRLFFLIIFTLVSNISFLPNLANAISTNDFYFDEAIFDYYLEKTEDGSSKMHVVEYLTAVFPETDQNHGITRSIPFTNQGGHNSVAESYADLDFHAWRNGNPEPIAKKETENGNYIFYLGDKNEYVHGKQLYRLEYDFHNVITQFNNNGKLTWADDSAAFQELYWDTNGTGWNQNFNHLKANLHLPKSIADNLLPNTSCYVGYYGEKGLDRCDITSDDQTSYDKSAINASSNTQSETVISFETYGLKAEENLTFAVDFKPGTFFVPEPKKNYSGVYVSVVAIAVLVLIVIILFVKYCKIILPKKRLQNSLFVAPQYEPPADLMVADAAELYLGRKKHSHVATLLELAIQKKITLIKGEESKTLFGKRENWDIRVNSLEGITAAQEDVLHILRGAPVHVGDEFRITSHTATTELVRIGREYDSTTKKRLERLGLTENNKANKPNFSFFVGLILIIGFFIYPVSYGLIVSIGPYGVEEAYGSLVIYVTITYIIVGIILSMINTSVRKYISPTMKGIEVNAKLEGLRDYISMAEKDRIAFMQSVKGVNTSNEGIVKIYEKLLPYAVIFGLEESWMKELNKYYELDNNLDHSWYSGTDYISASMISNMMVNTSSSISSSSTYYSSSSSSSSGSSGGGGGGSSGGGGGGGGGGGW